MHNQILVFFLVEFFVLLDFHKTILFLVGLIVWV